MIFDSFEFAVFCLFVFTIYYLLRHRVQNLFLLAASYFFYGFWSWKFLALLVATQVIDFHISKAMHRLTDEHRRRRLMWLSVCVNMGVLGFFKYFNFFTENIQGALNLLGVPVSQVTLNIVLPVGISFYTIQEVVYIVDVYKRRVAPAQRFVDFALFVSYFPQLMAGPIERAERLLPQVQSKRTIRYADVMEGGWLIFWGLFKKMFVADRLALFVDPIFAAPEATSAPLLLLGALAFTVQIYADFSGYSDIAIGLGRLMGFHLMWNFNLPFFAASPSDFWRRWHISLSQCLRDNIYIPLGGNRVGLSREVIAIMATMLLSGLWHGAQWHFVLWGAYCGVLLCAERIVRRTGATNLLSSAEHTTPVTPSRLLQIAIMLPLTILGFSIFRAEGISDVTTIFSRIATQWGDVASALPGLKELVICTALLGFYEMAQFFSGDRFIIFRAPLLLRMLLYFFVYLHITLGAPHDARTFIYFQF